MATGHVWPFDTVGSGRSYDSDPHHKSPVTAPGAVTTDKRIPPCVGHAVYSPDYESERPGDYLEERGGQKRSYGETLSAGTVIARHFGLYPAPLRADLVTLWKRNGTTVLSITADGKVHDFHLPPARLVVLLREIAEQLAENTVLN